MKVYTLVCTHCHAGWYSDSPTGVHDKCKKDAVLRGQYLEIPLRSQPSQSATEAADIINATGA